MTALRLVVPSERHVGRLTRAGAVAETRDGLRGRLLAALEPAVVFATASEARVALAAHVPFVVEVDAAIGELRAGGIEPDDLATSGRSLYLAGAMRAVDEALAARSRVDARRAGAVLARALRRASPEAVRDAVGSERVVARGIVVWEISDLAWWRALDDALSRAGGSATIELPAIDRPLDADRDRTPLEIVSDAVAEALEAPPPLEPMVAPLGDLSFYGALAKGSDRVEVRGAADARGQARAAVDAVARALADGVPADRIAVAFPGIDRETLAPIARLLDEAGVPFDAPDASLAKSSGLVACALDAISLAGRGLRREHVASLLRSSYVRLADGAPTTRALACALEETPTERADDPVTSLEATARAWTESESFDVAPLSRRVGELLDSATAARTAAEQVGAARAIWRGLGLEPRADEAAAIELAADDPRSGLARRDALARARDARAWTALGVVMDSIAAAGASRLSTDELIAEIVRALDEAPVVAPPATTTPVRVAPIGELAGEPLDLLVVVDANEGSLASAASKTTLLAGVEVTGDPSRASLPTSRVRGARELAQLAVAASGAARVVVCHRDRADDGTLLAPAPLVSWLARSGLASARWTAAPLAGRPITRGESRLAAIAAGEPIAPDATRRARVERAREAFFESADAKPSDVCGVMALDAARAAAISEATGGGDRPLAVTSLEQIAQCPFKGFASVVLGARGDGAVDESPEARDVGTMVHKALAAAFHATESLWGVRPRDREAILARGVAAAAVAIGEVDPASPLRRLAKLRARDDVVAVLEWSLADEAWSFSRAEQPFGSSARTSWLPLVIDDGTTRVSLRGSIDRVDTDVAKRAVRAIDYKTSESAATSAGRTLGETSFQIAVYASAAAQALEATSVDGLYVPTTGRALGPGYERPAAAASKWAEATADAGGRTRADARILEVVRELRAGRVAPRPADASACAHCPFDGGCRKPRFAIAPTDDEGAA